jgi:hypothetical protein
VARTVQNDAPARDAGRDQGAVQDQTLSRLRPQRGSFITLPASPLGDAGIAAVRAGSEG